MVQKNKKLKRLEKAMDQALKVELEAFEIIELILKEEFEKELIAINPQIKVSMPDMFEYANKRVCKPKKKSKMLASA